MKLVSTLLVSSLAVISTAASARAVEPIRPDQLATLQALIKPSLGEDKWAAIPWQTDLWQARKLAAQQGKPILLWEMDGHPLGCT